jgi:hypothetical protein
MAQRADIALGNVSVGGKLGLEFAEKFQKIASGTGDIFTAIANIQNSMESVADARKTNKLMEVAKIVAPDLARKYGVDPGYVESQIISGKLDIKDLRTALADQSNEAILDATFGTIQGDGDPSTPAINETPPLGGDKTTQASEEFPIADEQQIIEQPTETSAGGPILPSETSPNLTGGVSETTPAKSYVTDTSDIDEEVLNAQVEEILPMEMLKRLAQTVKDHPELRSAIAMKLADSIGPKELVALQKLKNDKVKLYLDIISGKESIKEGISQRERRQVQNTKDIVDTKIAGYELKDKEAEYEDLESPANATPTTKRGRLTQAKIGQAERSNIPEVDNVNSIKINVTEFKDAKDFLSQESKYSDVFDNLPQDAQDHWAQSYARAIKMPSGYLEQFHVAFNAYITQNQIAEPTSTTRRKRR